MKEKGEILGVISVATSWAIPLLGLTLGIIGRARAKKDNVILLNNIGIGLSIAFWIIWAFILL